MNIDDLNEVDFIRVFKNVRGEWEAVITGVDAKLNKVEVVETSLFLQGIEELIQSLRIRLTL